MPLNAAKAFFEVTAGIIPGTPMPEFTKRWGYTSADYEEDRSVEEGQTSIFAARLREAHDYAIELSHPARLNWVRVDWIWI